MKDFTLKPIGIIQTPFTQTEGMPIQPPGGRDIRGTVILRPEFVEGLTDLDGFSHIILLYQFHLTRGYSLRLRPFLDSETHGVFATRAPNRPNPIGISVVRLERIEGNKLIISNIDILDGTPVLDIKPYIPDFDPKEQIRIGWFEGKSDQANVKRSDSRFN
jgi:tRNA-Thr(GGU) m(6)t(6)A37 methyltransferase TsaA